MKNRLFLITAITALTISFGGCAASFSTNGSNAAKSGAASSPAVKNTDSASTAKAEKPKTPVQNEKNPEGTAKTAKKEVPVPADWVYLYDENKGYGFSVPAGTTNDTDNSNGIDFTALTTPSGIDIFALAYKDKTLTKEDLLKDAVTFTRRRRTKSQVRRVKSGKLGLRRRRCDDHSRRRHQRKTENYGRHGCHG